MHVLFLYPYLPARQAAHGSARLVSRLLADVREHARVTLICQHRPGEEGLLPDAAQLCDRLVCLPRPLVEDMGPAQRLAEMAHTAYGLLSSGDPLPVVKLHRRRFAQAVRSVVAEDPPDVVQVELAPLAAYVPLFAGRPSVLVDHEAGGLDGPQAARWRAFLRRCYPRFSRVMALGEEDAAAIAAAVPGLQVGLRPAGIDLPAVAPRRPVPGRVLFFGSASHAPNRDALSWLVGEILPVLRRAVPEVVVAVAGMQGAELESRASGLAGIERLGFVEDLGGELARAAVVLSPVRLGRGVRIKNLETLAHGVPLVTTALGAQGIARCEEQAFVVADGVEALARATADLLAQRERAERMGAAGRRLVTERHTRAHQVGAALEAWRLLTTPGGSG